MAFELGADILFTDLIGGGAAAAGAAGAAGAFDAAGAGAFGSGALAAGAGIAGGDSAIAADAGLATAADASAAGGLAGSTSALAADAGLATAADVSTAGGALAPVLDSPGVIPGALDSGASGAESFPGGAGGGGAALSDEALITSGAQGDLTGFAGQGADAFGGGVPAAATGGAGDPAMQGLFDKAVKYGPLALQGANMLANRGLSQKYAKQFSDLGKPQRDVANSMIADAQAGRINPADQFAIDQWAQGAIAQAKQYYAKAGLSDSSMAAGAIADINNRAAAMKEKARQDLLTTGMNALNITDQLQAKAITAEMSGDQTAANQATAFLSAYGNWLRATSTSGQSTPAPAQPAA